MIELRHIYHFIIQSRSCGQHENCNYIYEIFIDGIEVAAHADGEGRFSNFIEILNY